MTMPFIRQIGVLTAPNDKMTAVIADADVPFVFGEYGIPQPHYVYFTWDNITAQCDTEFNVEYKISNGIYSKGLDPRFLSKARSPIQVNFGSLTWPDTFTSHDVRADVHITFEFVSESWQISAISATIINNDSGTNINFPLTIAFS